jgi:hypothetical protein
VSGENIMECGLPGFCFSGQHGTIHATFFRLIPSGELEALAITVRRGFVFSAYEKIDRAKHQYKGSIATACG